MATREQETGAEWSRAAKVLDDTDFLQALQFAHQQLEPPALAAGALAGDDRESTIPQPEGPLPMERRSRESLITVPPATGSVPPPPLPPLPALRVPRVAQKPAVSLPPIAAAFVAAIRFRAVRSAGHLTWVVLIATIGIALPSGLLLGRALTSRAGGSAASEPTKATAATPTPLPDNPGAAIIASAGPVTSDEVPAVVASTSSTHALSYPPDWSLLVRVPRPLRHGKGKSAPKPVASTVSVDAPGNTSASTRSRSPDVPADSDAAP